MAVGNPSWMVLLMVTAAAAVQQAQAGERLHTEHMAVADFQQNEPTFVIHL